MMGRASTEKVFMDFDMGGVRRRGANVENWALRHSNCILFYLAQ